MIEYTVSDEEGALRVVDREIVREQIRARFGTSVADGTALVEQLMTRFEKFLPGADDFAILRQDLNDLIFNTLYSKLGPKMTVTARRRPHSYAEKDIDEAADELVASLIEKLRVCEFYYVKIREFFLRTGSTRALKILRERYTPFLKAGEMEILERIASENGDG